MIATSADGVSIAYTVLGAGAPVVLLHGFTETAESWQEAGYVDRFLRAGRQVVLVDCRGHGGSGKPHDAAAYGGGKRASDVVAVLDALGLRTANLVGYSMGGMIALATALRFPARVRALVIMGAHPFAQDMTSYRHAVADSMERWLAMLDGQGVELTHNTRQRMLANDIRALQACVAHDRFDSSAALAALKAPLLAIAGTQDPIFPAVRAFAERVDGCFLALEGRNHVTAFLAAGEIVTAIERFIGNQAGVAAESAQTEAEQDQDARAMCSRHATFYQSRIMPYFIHGGCSMPTFARMRERFIPKARGVVAEIGFGSGLNLPYYDPAKVSRLIGIEPDPSMLGIARKRLADFRMPIELIEGRAEALPLPDGSVDTAVVTYALCTISDPGRALCEIRRILKPGGRLLFIEHERSTEPWRSRWQDRLNGLWGRLAGGCHLDRAPLRLIEEAGFVIRVRQQERFPLHLWQLGTQSGGEAWSA
jgi:pimeloyl-ACP methyl ester carboxylesterase/ubiquinone/menaquinone biosynthesis C-methylase UbiE